MAFKKKPSDAEAVDGMPPDLVMETWPIDRFVPYVRNPRVHAPETVARMAGAIREFGFRLPCLALSDGTLVDGHLRLEAARQLGIDRVPVVLADDLTDAQVKAFRLLSRNSAMWSPWDPGLLELELADLRAADFDLDLTGFALGELEAIDLGADLEAGDPDGPMARTGSLAERFGVPPFSVLNAREGWWQERKRAWIALGIKSELGRGENLSALGGAIERREAIGEQGEGKARGLAVPGGSAEPLARTRAGEKGWYDGVAGSRVDPEKTASFKNQDKLDAITRQRRGKDRQAGGPAPGGGGTHGYLRRGDDGFERDPGYGKAKGRKPDAIPGGAGAGSVVRDMGKSMRKRHGG